MDKQLVVKLYDPVIDMKCEHNYNGVGVFSYF